MANAKAKAKAPAKASKATVAAPVREVAQFARGAKASWVRVSVPAQVSADEAPLFVKGWNAVLRTAQGVPIAGTWERLATLAGEEIAFLPGQSDVRKALDVLLDASGLPAGVTLDVSARARSEVRKAGLAKSKRVSLVVATLAAQAPKGKKGKAPSAPAPAASNPDLDALAALLATLTPEQLAQAAAKAKAARA